MGYFYCFSVKNSNHLHTELSLGYVKDTKFYFENRASFIYICFIYAVIDSLVVGIVHFLGQFRGYLEALALVKIHPVRKCFPKKIHVLLSNFFSSSNMFFIRLFLANT